MKGTINRRDFLKYSLGGVAVLVVGSKLTWLPKNQAFAVTQTLNFHITDAIKEMHTHETGLLDDGTKVGDGHEALCYFWLYKSVSPDLPAENPGPTIMATRGDTISISITNDLDEPHAFYIPGMFDSGPINPGQTKVGSFTAATAGAHLYYDNLNSPVNRVMGLHGAFIVLPAEGDRTAGHKLTPYGGLAADHPVQKLYDDFGSSAHYPGLAWEEGDEATYTPPFRHYLWLLNEASPVLFAEVGSLSAGEVYNAQQFMDRFLRDPFSPNPNNSRRPQYFLISGQSGHFAHNNCYVTPMGRVGEPAVVHILNAGLWLHSMHLHANHMYITSVNGVVQTNPIWVDVYNVHPMDRVDYTIPFMRPPDVPNQRGIGYPDTPKTTVNGAPCWPPTEECNVHIPGIGEDVAKDRFGNNIDLTQRLSPLCYPMHDHAEPSQTTQGGNYNTALISGIYFTGDRNTLARPSNTPADYPASYPLDFPMDEDWHLMYGTGIDRGCEIEGTHEAAPPSRHDDH
ncbi:MAG: multicopper oxidase domain-containing protein [Chloroflexi bacterium]|nr:multicopper oxidase domain-containing protein [Chloroflexota bacterium]